MYHKKRDFRRKARAQQIRRKSAIITDVYQGSLDNWVHGQPGRLSKAKVHCSCRICQQKSTRCFGKPNNSLSGYSAADLRKFDALSYTE